MPITDFKLEYKSVNENKDGVPVVIVAAGSSSRMQGKNKIFSLIGGIPLIARTMLAFERSKYISEIIVVTKEENIADIRKAAGEFMITKLSAVTKGGSDRLKSVLNGLEIIENAHGVLVHDGARPFVSEAVIERLVNAVKDFPCTVCAVKLKDTVKQRSSDNVKTLDRNSLYAVQTPQAFDFNKYKELSKNCENTCDFTDDASVMENAGYNTNIVEGEECNIKITTPFDLIIAESIIKENPLCE